MCHSILMAFLQNASPAGLETNLKSPDQINCPREEETRLQVPALFQKSRSHQCPTLPSSEYIKALWEVMPSEKSLKIMSRR